MADFTRAYHRTTYPSISPTQSALSQAGRTVLVAGSSTGIGFAICRAFVAASVSRLVLLGRRGATLEDAKNTLLSLAPHKLEVLAEQCDITKEADVSALWDKLRANQVAVDALVLNAALGIQVEEMSKAVPAVWTMYENNVLANLRMTEKFLVQGSEKGKVLLNVSSVVTHLSPAVKTHGAISATKAAFASLFQNIADETQVERAQMISFHPGTVFTAASVTAGFDKDTFHYDDEDLAGHFAVWLASREAAFLHGRFVWAQWDVKELQMMRSRLEENVGLLRIGLQGVEPLTLEDFLPLVTAE